MKKIIIRFSPNKEMLVMQVGSISAGPFTLIEAVLSQLDEFYRDNIVSKNEICNALNYLIPRGNLKTNTLGYLTVFYLLHELFPFYSIKLSNHLSDKIFLVRSFNGYKQFFAIPAAENMWTGMSDFFFHKYELFKFLNFMKRIGVITDEKFDFLDDAVNELPMPYPCRTALNN